MTSTRSSLGKNGKENKKCKIKLTVSHNEDSSPALQQPCCQQIKTRKKTKPIRRCALCKCKKTPEDTCNKLKSTIIGNGMIMYMDRLSEFGVTHCQCHKPKHCCCKCAVFKDQPVAQSVVYPKQRPICQKVCFIDDPPYTLPKKNQRSRLPEAHCKQCCPCGQGFHTHKNGRLDVWRHLPEIASRTSLRQHPPEGKRWEDVSINSSALCRAKLKDCETETRLRCRLPSWVCRC